MERRYETLKQFSRSIESSRVQSLNRRDLVKGTVGLALSIPLASALLVACGDDDGEEPQASGSDDDADVAEDGDDAAEDEDPDEQDSDESEEPDENEDAGDEPSPEPTGDADERPPFVFAQGVDAIFLDPQLDPSIAQRNIHQQTHDTLVYFNRDAELTPRLAETYEVTSGTSIVFNLREGVLFHDGTELTAEDVKFSLERCYVAPKTMATELTCEWELFIEEISIEDDYTLEVVLKAPDGTFLARLTRLFIVPEEAVRSMGADGYNEQAIGTGPFRVVEWVKDQHVLLEAFDDHWDGPPPFSQVTIRPIPEASTAVSALRSGEIDMMVNVPPDSVQLLEEHEDTRAEISPSNRLIFIYLNTFQPPFDDVLVRRAVNHAVDWDAIVEHVLNGQGYQTPCPITPYDFPYDALQDICGERAYPYDPERARELLAEAGYPDGFEFDLEGPDGRYLQDAEVLEAVGGFLEEVGLRPNVRPQEWGIYYQERFLGELVQAGLFGMGNSLNDMDTVFAFHFDPNRRSPYYNTPRLTEISELALSTIDVEERERLYREAMEIIIEDAPWIFGYGQMNIFGVRNHIEWTPYEGFELPYFKEMAVRG